MAANTYLQVTELDFADIRTNLQTYLSTQSQFKDYDFEGSAMSVLLDVLAYNTHYNAYYLNMIGNEMFLDTAQQRDSVVSRAKELGYVPISAIGATADVTLNFTGVAASVPQFTVPKNSKFTTSIDDVTYTYVTSQVEKIDQSATGTFSKTITIKEGEPLTHAWTASASNPVRYIIPNNGVDTTSITVSVQESAADSTVTEFTRATNVNQVFETSPVFFLEEASDKKYELVFGQGGLGKAIKSGNIIKASYLVCSGDATNGANTFSVESISTGLTPTPTATITAVTKNAAGGRSQEDVDSIKFNAPRNFQTQNRAVVANDYQRILLSENPDLQSVISYGGEEATPPAYGKVYIAVKPFDEQFATATRKQAIRESIKTRTPLAIDPVIIDADYVYLIPTISTYYDTTRTTLSLSSVEQMIRDSIDSFASTNLQRFGNKLRYSRFVRALDNTSTTILNNDAAIKVQKRFVPNVNVAENVLLSFQNELRPSTVESTEFTYNGFSAYLGDDGAGNATIFRYSDANAKVTIVDIAGTVNYTTGEIVITNFAPTAYADIQIKVSAKPENFDINSVREQILLMNSSDATINVYGEQG
jgi:hypothetical protein